jgi:hypothetical protein
MTPHRLDEMEAEFESANVRLGEATWNTYSGERVPDLDRAQEQLASLLTDESDRRMVEQWLSLADPAKEPVLFRRLIIWRNCFVSSAVDNVPELYNLKNRLQRRIAEFEFEFEGRKALRSELQKIQRTDPDRDRRHRAWLAAAPLAAANRDDLRRLITLRNRKSRNLGFRDYVDLVLKLQEIEEGWLRSTLHHLAETCRPLYAATLASLADRIGVSRMAPWDVSFAIRQGIQLADSFFPSDRTLERLFSTAKALGFEVDSLPIRTLVRDIPFGGYNVAVKIPGDTRFLVNPSEGQAIYTTTFHEYGHSLQAVFTATPWPILKEYEWVMGAHTAAYSEGMAEVMGDFVRRADWLGSVAGVPDAEIERYESQVLPAQSVIRLFDLLSNMYMELAAYSESGEDLGARDRTVMREIRLLEFPDEDPPLWEANTWYTSYPIYWQNYILASLIAAQIHDAITSRFGLSASSNPGIAKYLQENFYSRGNEIPWNDRVVRGTGKPLADDSYLHRILNR